MGMRGFLKVGVEGAVCEKRLERDHGKEHGNYHVGFGISQN